MKRADIKPGMDVLVSTARDWANYGWGERYRIVDTERYGDVSSRWAREVLNERVIDGVTYRVNSKIVPDVKGTGVLAVLLNGDGNPATNLLTLVTTSEVKATWTDAQAEIARVKADRDAERARKKAESDAARAEAAELNRLLEAAGVKMRIASYDAPRRTVSVSFDDLRILLAEVEA